MVEIIGVKFNSAGKVYYFDPKGAQLGLGARVLVETARGVEMGKVVIPNKMVEEREIVPPLKEILRVADQADFQRERENREKEKEAFRIASEKIAEHRLDMKLVGAEYTFDRSKILFYFTADGRVDFRDLVKSLAGVFHTRIELRQIGVRDEARQLGSLGICGRFLCCSTFLNDFHPVSIKMAKEQGLSLNPTKISGVCGRLMCCLQYEQNAYDDMLAKMPRKGERVKTPDGPGIVVETATLKGQVKVKFQDSNGELLKFETYDLGQLLHAGKPGRGRRNQDQGREEIPEGIGEVPEAGVETETQESAEPGVPRPKRNRRKRRKGQSGGGTAAAAGENPTTAEKPAQEEDDKHLGDGQSGSGKPRRRRPRHRGGKAGQGGQNAAQSGSGGHSGDNAQRGGYSGGY